MTSIFSTIAITAAANYTCYDNEMGPLREEPFSGSWAMVYNADTEIGVCDYMFNAFDTNSTLVRIQIEAGDECRLNPGGSGTSEYGVNVTTEAGVATGSLSWSLEGFDSNVNNLLMVYDGEGICIGCTEMQSSVCPATNAPSASPTVTPITYDSISDRYAHYQENEGGTKGRKNKVTKGTKGTKGSKGSKGSKGNKGN